MRIPVSRAMAKAVAASVAAALLTVLTPGGASAQTSSHGFLNLNLAVQSAAAGDFSQHATAPFRQETETIDFSYAVRRHVAFDVGGGVMVTPHFGVGLAVGRFISDQPAGGVDSVPNFFVFNQPVIVTFKTPAMGHSETVVHLDGVFATNLTPAARLTVFGGPSRFRVAQSLITNVSELETLNVALGTDVITIGSASTTTVEATAWGFNVGTDVSYFFNRTFGVGALVRYSGATVDFSNFADALFGNRSTSSVKAGGVTAGGGVRILF